MEKKSVRNRRLRAIARCPGHDLATLRATTAAPRVPLGSRSVLQEPETDRRSTRIIRVRQAGCPRSHEAAGEADDLGLSCYHRDIPIHRMKRDQKSNFSELRTDGASS